jgi:hypothetical protein
MKVVQIQWVSYIAFYFYVKHAKYNYFPPLAKFEVTYQYDVLPFIEMIHTYCIDRAWNSHILSVFWWCDRTVMLHFCLGFDAFRRSPDLKDSRGKDLCHGCVGSTLCMGEVFWICLPWKVVQMDIANCLSYISGIPMSVYMFALNHSLWLQISKTTLCIHFLISEPVLSKLKWPHL